MNEITPSTGMMFEFQRDAMRQTNQAIQRSFEIQREFVDTFVDLEPAKSANERSYQALHTAVDAYFDALEAATPGQTAAVRDARGAVVDQINTLETSQLQAIESLESNLQEGREATDELLADFIDALDEQVETVVEANEDIEAETVEAVDEFEDTLEELQGEQAAHLEQFEVQLRDLQRRMEDVTETAIEQSEAHLDATSGTIESIEGIGPTYAQRLREQGIESFDALSTATADAIAEAADVSVEQAEQWIDAAQTQN